MTVPEAAAQSRSDRPHRYIPGIDGLRAIAVLSVLIYHVNQAWLPGGFAGVDVFFVISGFVVTYATSQIRARSFPDLVLSFYRRRFLRVLPAALIFVLVAQFAAILFIPVTLPRTVPDETGVAAALGLSNIVLWYRAGDYFAPDATLNPFTHTWSLAVEEQFYFIFPILAAIVFGLGRGGRRQIGLTLLGALIAASLTVSIVYTSRDQSFAFYLLPARLWQLGAGMMLYLMIGSRPEPAGQPGVEISILSVAGVACLAWSLTQVSPERFPFPDALFPTAAALLLITATVFAPAGVLSRLLSWQPMRSIGNISYSLYLWHWVSWC